MFKRDSGGLALSLDLLLALIPITIILGLVAANMGNIMYETQDTIYRSSIERSAQDTANALLKTSGDPYNWEKLSASQVKSVGLAKYDNSSKLSKEYVLSVDKVGAVTPSRVQSLLGSQYGFYLNITTLNGSQIRNLTSENDTKNLNTASDVVTVERLVLISEFDIVAEFKNIRLTSKPPTLTSYFPTNQAYLDAFDYYVYIEKSNFVSSGWVEVNHVTGTNRAVGTNDPWNVPPLVKKIDPVIQKLYNETNLRDNIVQTQLRGSPGDTASVYIIQVPKGTPIEKVSPAGAAGVRAKFRLHVWTR